MSLPSFVDAALAPLFTALAAVVATAHATLTAQGADLASGAVWVLCFVAVVVVERRRIAAEHGVPRLGLLPLLAQVPLWTALYHLLSQVAVGVPVAAVDAALVASLGAATVLGVPLVERGYLGAGWAHLLVVVALAGTAALLSWVTQTFLVAPNAAASDVPDAVVRVQQLLPALSAVGLLVAAGFVPLVLLVYWVCNGAWTLGQAAVVMRWFPTPGSPAAARACDR